MSRSQALGRGLDQLLEPGPLSTEHTEGPFDSRHRLRDLLGVGRRDRLTTDQIAREFSFPSAEAARKYLNRYDVPRETRGRILLVDRRDIEASIEKHRKSRLLKSA